MFSALRGYFGRAATGGWSPRSSSDPTDSPTVPTRSERPVSEPGFGWESLTGEEQDRILDFAHRGIGTQQDVTALLKRLPVGMALDFRIGHRQAIEARRHEMELYRVRLRERAAEARRDKCTRQPASS